MSNIAYRSLFPMFLGGLCAALIFGSGCAGDAEPPCDPTQGACAGDGGGGSGGGDGGQQQDGAAGEGGGSDGAGGSDGGGGDSGGKGSGQLLILLDRSGSMAQCKLGGVKRETIVADELATALGAHASTPVGLAVFPDTLLACGLPAACDPGRVVVAPGAGKGAEINSYIEKMPDSCGGAPTGSTLEAMLDYVDSKWSAAAGRRYLLLLTDGQPNCDDGDNGSGMMCKPDGSTGCANPTRAYEALDLLRAADVDTFVVLFDPSDEPACASTSQADPDTFEKLAMHGNAPGPGGVTVAPYFTDTRAELGNALEQVFKTVEGHP